MFIGRVGALIFVNEIGQVAKLKLECCPDTMFVDDLSAALDDLRSVRDATLMVVGYVEDIQVLEVEFLQILHGD